MNKNFRVIQIYGLSGLLLLGFALTGAFCGFVIFPVWVIMNVWNAVVCDILKGPAINYFQAALLWAACALMCYLLLRNSISINIQREGMIENIEDTVNKLESENIESPEDKKD